MDWDGFGGTTKETESFLCSLVSTCLNHMHFSNLYFRSFFDIWAPKALHRRTNEISNNAIYPHSSEIRQTVRPQNMFLQKISSMSKPQRSSPSLPHRSLQCLWELWDLRDLRDLRCLWCLRWFWRLRHVHLQQWRSQLPPAVDETRNKGCLN